MYEEKKFIRKKIRWSSVFLKLLLLVLVALLVWFVIYKHKDNKNNKPKGNTMPENLIYFKKQAIDYFTIDKLPKYINGRVKLSLEDLIKENAIKEIYDKDGNKCSNISSYAQVIRLDDKNYNLKVYLKCKNEADSILTTINTDKNKTKATNTKKDDNTNKVNTTNNTNNTNNISTKNDDKKTTTTNTQDKNSTTKQSGSKTSSSSTKQSSSSLSSSSKTSTSQSSSTTVVTTKTTKTETSSSSSSTTSSSTSSSSSSSSSSSTTTSSSSSSSSSSTSEQGSTTKTEEKKKELAYTEYKMVKYGKATINKPEKGNYVTKKIELKYYKYCHDKDTINCDVFPELDKYENEINVRLYQGYQKIYDHSEYITVYIPYECLWSRSQTVEGYEYSGEYKEYYRYV